MLHRSIHERAVGALLGSDLVGSVLHSHLIALLGKPESLPVGGLRRELAGAIQRDIDQRTGRSLRLNEISHTVDSLCDGLLSEPDILELDTAFDAVLAAGANGEIHVKDIHVHRYAQTLAEVDPTLLVAWRLVKWSGSAGSKPAPLRQAVEGLGTLFVGPRFDKLGFAENHAHFSGVVGNELVLSQIVLGQAVDGAEPKEADVRDRVRRIRRILETLVSLWSDNGVKDESRSKTWVLDALQVIPDVDKGAQPDAYIDWETLAKGIAPKAAREARVRGNWLLWMLAEAASKGQFQSAWNWLFIALWWTYRNAKGHLAGRAIILFLIADIMALRRTLLMDGNGLRRFTSRHFASPLRDAAKGRLLWHTSSSKDVAQRLFARRGDKAAIKVGLDTLNKDWLPLLAADVNERMREHEGGAPLRYAQSRQHWHLCAHFNRFSKEQSREELWDLAVSFRSQLHSDAPWQLPPLPGDEHLGTVDTIFPADVVRGLDVVGDETQWPIERFAPMLRWLRSTEAAPVAPLKLPEKLGPRRGDPRLHLSVHAGEDYAHPLSGLRHIAETVVFCAMGKGDRLGHALALGIPPDEWLSRHGEVALPLDDHVDNLVWAWHEATQLLDLEMVDRVLPRLKKRIQRFLPHVSWYPTADAALPLTDEQLRRMHDAWELRKNCRYRAIEQIGVTPVVGPDLDVAAPDWRRIQDVRDAPSTTSAEGLYVLRAVREASPLPLEQKPAWMVHVATLRHGHLTRRQRELEELDDAAVAAEAKKPKPILHDHDNADDLSFMHALQDICIERYAQHGLSIEANPSSNVYIGQLETHSDHPIFRWDPPKSDDLQNSRLNRFNRRLIAIPVTINTDDAGMMPTTLRLEHQLMHEAAIDRGYTVEEADAWIERLRVAGMTMFDNAN